MRRTIVYLRGFQPPRTRTSGDDVAATLCADQRASDAAPRKRPRADSPPPPMETPTASPPLHAACEVIDAETPPTPTTAKSVATTTFVKLPTVPMLSSMEAMAAAEATSAAQSEDDALMENADDLRREVEEDMRLSADLPFTPSRAHPSPPSQMSLPQPDDPEDGIGSGFFSFPDFQEMEAASSENARVPSNLPASVRLATATASSSTFYDLPRSVQHFFATRRGVRQLYPWQHEVLMRDDLRNGGSLVYSMPTSGGKTLVAEISLLRCVMNRKKSCLLVMPYVSLAEEKCAALEPLGDAFDFAVEGHYGTRGRFPLAERTTMFVCTTEKANSLLNHMLEEGLTERIGTVVVDELHMLGENLRGGKLELFLSKLLCLPHDVQIVGMSATIPNLPSVASWLRAGRYVGDYRPVPLRQHSVADGMVVEEATRHVRNLVAAGHQTEAEQLLLLATEVTDGSVLVFCSSRQQCVDTAHLIAQQRRSAADAQGAVSSAIAALVDDLGSVTNGAAAKLVALVQHRVAFHHAGLLAEERELIERAYRSRLIDVLCCTSTLAAGVNLPARRVILKTPYVGIDFLTKARYLQMCGRAGRAGLDEYGESFLLLSRRNVQRGRALMRCETEPCTSQMLVSLGGLQRAILECIAVGTIRTRASAYQWASNLLFPVAPGPCDAELEAGARPLPLVLDDAVEATIERLVADGFVQRRPRDGEAADGCAAEGEEVPWLSPTPFGASAVRSCFSIDDALLLRQELEEVQLSGLILADDLHLCYFVTPLHEFVIADWGLYRDVLAQLDEKRQRIAAMVGVDEFLVQKCAMGLCLPGSGEKATRQVFTAQRFFVALILADLLSEVPMDVVGPKFGCNRGQLQSLMHNASIFSSSITNFCHAMGWFSLEAVIASFVKRLGFGVKPDIVPLMEIKGVQPPRARALWAAGFRNPAAIAAATPQELLQRVKSANPADSKTVKFFTLRSAINVVREANILLQSHIREKKGELMDLTMRARSAK